MKSTSTSAAQAKQPNSSGKLETVKEEDESASAASRSKMAKMFDENSMFNPADPVATLRNLTNMGSKEIIGAMIDKINMVVDGGQLI